MGPILPLCPRQCQTAFSLFEEKTAFHYVRLIVYIKDNQAFKACGAAKKNDGCLSFYPLPTSAAQRNVDAQKFPFYRLMKNVFGGN
jgi:hypothetical protein